jgi:hypothetical protein
MVPACVARFFGRPRHNSTNGEDIGSGEA